MSNRILPIVVFVIAGLVFFLYINPTWTGSIASTKADIANYDNALTAAKQYQAKQDELLQEKNAIAPSDLDRLQEFLPDGVNNVQLILDLNALAARTGVSLSDFDTSNSSGSDGAATAAAAPSTSADSGDSALALANNPVNSLDITLTATASYASFRAFLSGIEHSLRLLDVTAVTIAPSSTGVYDYQMNIRLYWLK